MVSQVMLNQVHNIDALELLSKLEPASVDLILTDLPYGITACSWDSLIPFAPMWEGVKRALKPNGTFITTASQPFTSLLIMSNLAAFKYEWIWEKSGRSSNFVHAKNMPIKSHENVVVFSFGKICHADNTKRDKMTYNPQGLVQEEHIRRKSNHSVDGHKLRRNSHPLQRVVQYTHYPKSVFRFISDKECLHPTQKPVELYRYLVMTYSLPNELIVDFCCGSGTTAVAAASLNRNFIVGDTDAGYCAAARKRLAMVTPDMFAGGDCQLY